MRGVHVKAAEVRWVVPGNTKDGFRSIVVSDFELVEFNLVLVVTQAAREACTFCKRKGEKKKNKRNSEIELVRLGRLPWFQAEEESAILSLLPSVGFWNSSTCSGVYILD